MHVRWNTKILCLEIFMRSSYRYQNCKPNHFIICWRIIFIEFRNFFLELLTLIVKYVSTVVYCIILLRSNLRNTVQNTWNVVELLLRNFKLFYWFFWRNAKNFTVFSIIFTNHLETSKLLTFFKMARIYIFFFFWDI